MYTQLSIKEQTAKKAHRCSGCCEKIEPGHRYIYEAGTYYGEFHTIKLCLPCNKVMPAFLKFKRDEGEYEFEIGEVGSFRKGAIDNE